MAAGREFKRERSLDFCEGFLLGFSKGQANFQQNADIKMGGMEPENTFVDPAAFAMVSDSSCPTCGNSSAPHNLEPNIEDNDFLGFEAAGTYPDFSLEALQPASESTQYPTFTEEVSFERPQLSQRPSFAADVDLLFAQPETAQLASLTESDWQLLCSQPVYDEDAQVLFDRPEQPQQVPPTLANSWCPKCASRASSDPVNAQTGTTYAPANTYVSTVEDPFLSHYSQAQQQDPLDPGQSRFFTADANGLDTALSSDESFDVFGLSDGVFDYAGPSSDESCDLALSECGDDGDTGHVHGDGEAAGEDCSHANTTALTPSPEDHPMPCGREECHICQIFSLPF